MVEWIVGIISVQIVNYDIMKKEEAMKQSSIRGIKGNQLVDDKQGL